MMQMIQGEEYYFYSAGFFGYGEEGNFVPWSIWHIIPLVLVAVAIFLVWHYREALRNWKGEPRLRFIYAFIMLIVEMSYFWRVLYIGNEWGEMTLMTKLPLQVCQWGLICAVFTLMSDNDALFGINFFITTTLTIPAFLLPDVLTFTGPGYYRYYQYWLEHGMPLIAVFYMMFVRGKRPKYWHLWLSAGMLALLSIPSLIANHTIPNANYMYLGNFAEGSTTTVDPVSFFPDSQVLRYIIMMALVIALFHLVFAIERLIERLARKKNKALPH